MHMKAILLGNGGKASPHKPLDNTIFPRRQRAQQTTRLGCRRLHNHAIVEIDSRLNEQQDASQQDGDEQRRLNGGLPAIPLVENICPRLGALDFPPPSP